MFRKDKNNINELFNFIHEQISICEDNIEFYNLILKRRGYHITAPKI